MLRTEPGELPTYARREVGPCDVATGSQGCEDILPEDMGGEPAEELNSERIPPFNPALTRSKCIEGGKDNRQVECTTSSSTAQWIEK